MWRPTHKARQRFPTELGVWPDGGPRLARRAMPLGLNAGAGGRDVSVGARGGPDPSVRPRGRHLLRGNPDAASTGVAAPPVRDRPPSTNPPVLRDLAGSRAAWQPLGVRSRTGPRPRPDASPDPRVPKLLRRVRRLHPPRQCPHIGRRQFPVARRRQHRRRVALRRDRRHRRLHHPPPSACADRAASPSVPSSRP